MIKKNTYLAVIIVFVLILIFPSNVYAESSVLKNDDIMNNIGISLLKEISSEIDDTVTVAVIDSGCNYQYSLFSGRIDNRRKNMLGYNDDDLLDSDSHGTAVCSLIADSTPSNVKILPLKVKGTRNDVLDYNIVNDAIEYAIDCNVDVINLSVLYQVGDGNTIPTICNESIQKALNRGIIICVAAGNFSTNAIYSYPSCIPGVITVSSYDTNRTSYANYGMSVDMVLPSSMFAYQKKDVAELVEGTSFSVACMSSIAAMLKLVNNDIDAMDITRLIGNNCTYIKDGYFDISYMCPNFNKIKNIEQLRFELNNRNKIRTSIGYR